MKYIARGWTKFAEEDKYQEGCMPGTAISFEENHTIKANSVEALLHVIKEDLHCNEEDILRDSCDEIGRVDVQRMEDENGDYVTEHELELWRKGKIRLWSATYTYYIEQCTPVSTIKPEESNNGQD